MKQKIVIKISMSDDRSRTRAMKIVVGVQGVISVAFDGDDKIVVTGEGIDSTNLTVKIRKKVGFTELLSVTAVEEKKEEKKEEKTAESKVEVPPMYWTPYPYGAPPVYGYEVRGQPQDNCAIM
ncbi:hypothetical protein ACHQM5_012606 [Ranunculus cassubicifolius]